MITPSSHSESLDAFLEEATRAWTITRRRHRETPAASTDVSATAAVATHSQPTQYPWRYWLMFLSLGVANSSDAAEILSLSYILSEEQFDTIMLNHTEWRAGVLAAAVFAGMLLGGLLVGCLGDWYGRRPMLILGLAVNATAGLAAGVVAWNVWILAVCRFVAGIGIGATVPPLFALCSELAPPSSRGFWVTVAASFWMVGSFYTAVTAWSPVSSPTWSNR